MYPRLAEKTIKNISETFKVLLVTGPRQTGKTTLLKKIMPKNMNYVSLDDEILRNFAKNEPKLFLETHLAPLLIDEAQYAPELFSYIKLAVDNNNSYGQYWLTGSQRFSLMDAVSESLAGRVGIIELNSFSYNEIKRNANSMKFEPNNFKKQDAIGVNSLFEYIFKGGMPELYVNDKLKRDIFYSSYINTYLNRDVRKITNIGNELLFENFIKNVASRTGEQLNYTSISKDVGVGVNTIKDWFSILVKTGIVYLLTPYSSNHLTRLTHMPKIIFMDTGLASYLEGFTGSTELQKSNRAGHYLETYVISEIVKNYNSEGITPNIFYYRDKEKNEIDLIFDQNDTLYPFEIKMTASPNERMIKNFNKLSNSNKKIGKGGIICLYDNLIPLNKDNYIIPISSVINISK